MLDIGLAYYYNTQYDKAIEYLEKFKSIEKKKELIQAADDFIFYANNAKSLMKNPVKVIFLNLGEDVNSSQSDYNPCYKEEEKTLFFTTNRKYNSLFKIYTHNVYLTTYSEGSWKKSKSAGSKINTSEDEVLSGISSREQGR